MLSRFLCFLSHMRATFSATGPGAIHTCWEATRTPAPQEFLQPVPSPAFGSSGDHQDYCMSSQQCSSQLASQPSGLQRWSQCCPQYQCFSWHLFKCQGLHWNQPGLHGCSCQSLNQPSSRQRCTKSCCPTRFSQLTRYQWCCQTSDCHRGLSCPSSRQSSTPHPRRCHHKWSR